MDVCVILSNNSHQAAHRGLNACEQSVDDITMPGWSFSSRFAIAV